MHNVPVYRFGPFGFDPPSRQLSRNGKPVRLSAPQSAILALLLSKAGTIVRREELLDAGWGRAAINDNSLNQVITRLRQLLSEGEKGASWIETIPQEGYRFTAAVQHAARPGAEVALETHLAPYRAFLQGQMELDTLDREGIARARATLEDAVRVAPDFTSAHIDLATACGLIYEASRLEGRPDAAALDAGVRAAHTACTIAPSRGESWSTLAFIRRLQGDALEAAAAAYRAMESDRNNWRLALRAAYACWGEYRLLAACHLLMLRPGLALAHWLRTTVFIARGALDLALEEARAGCAAQDAQPKGAGLPAIGLHLLHGLILAALGRLEEAVAELKAELGWVDSGQMFARECAANTWYALGAVYLRQRKRAEAEAAFKRALTIDAGHVSALAVLKGEAGPAIRGMDAAIGQAIVLARGNRHADAARVYREAVAQAPPGYAGWMLAVEPTLHPQAHPELWSDALTLVRTRAA